MGWEVIFPALVQYGVAGIIAGALLWILKGILERFGEQLKADRDNYMEIIQSQNVTHNNHLAHLDESVKTQSTDIAKLAQKTESGFDRTVDAIKSQTEILREVVRKE